MSGLDIAAGIAGLISLTIEVTSAGYKYLSAVRDASKSMSSILVELSTIQTILLKVDETVNSDKVKRTLGDGSGSLQSIGKIDKNVMDDCMAELTKLKEKLQKSLESNSMVKRFEWPFKEEKADAIVKKLHRFHQSFQTGLSADAL
jgi:hypothetical protein